MVSLRGNEIATGLPLLLHRGTLSVVNVAILLPVGGPPSPRRLAPGPDLKDWPLI